MPLTAGPAAPAGPGGPGSPRAPWGPSLPRAPWGPVSPWGGRGGRKSREHEGCPETPDMADFPLHLQLFSHGGEARRDAHGTWLGTSPSAPLSQAAASPRHFGLSHFWATWGTHSTFRPSPPPHAPTFHQFLPAQEMPPRRRWSGRSYLSTSSTGEAGRTSGASWTLDGRESTCQRRDSTSHIWRWRVFRAAELWPPAKISQPRWSWDGISLQRSWS